MHTSIIYRRPSFCSWVLTWIVGGIGAHDAGEGDLALHEVGGAVAAPCPELARPRVVAPPASLHRKPSGTVLSITITNQLEGSIR
jgi:hypothetical protein